MTSTENPSDLDNSSPRLYDTLAPRQALDVDFDESVRDPFDDREVFDLIRDLNDPEHPLTLEQLNVVELDKVHVDDKDNKVYILVR